MAMRVAVAAVALLAVAGLAAAQDPAPGWMAYARGTPPSGTQRVTFLSMKWHVGNDPAPSGAFFSPWFGMDPADNLNLIQPVNPWMGGQWVGYTEYFQWSPINNQNSNEIGANAGDVMHGTLAYDASTDSYKLTQTNMNSGESSSQVVQCQDGKKFIIPYVVYEKTWPCQDYPSDGIVTFFDIQAECDGKDCTDTMRWEPRVKDANCGMRANINSATNISITWNPNGESDYAKWDRRALIVRNSGGWAKPVAKAYLDALEFGA